MTSESLDEETFLMLMRRAGIELDEAAMRALLAELAPSCAVLAEMSARVRARLALPSESALAFRREPAAEHE
jgi:ribosomal protein L12E/L44/L45/RPP1/RPP2